MKIKIPLIARIILRLSLIAVLSLVLSGCAEVATCKILDTAYDNESATGVVSTEDPTVVENCDFIQNVQAKARIGGLLLQDRAIENVLNQLTIKTKELGGNVVLITSQHKGFNGSEAKGKAYACAK